MPQLYNGHNITTNQPLKYSYVITTFPQVSDGSPASEGGPDLDDLYQWEEGDEGPSGQTKGPGPRESWLLKKQQ